MRIAGIFHTERELSSLHRERPDGPPVLAFQGVDEKGYPDLQRKAYPRTSCLPVPHGQFLDVDPVCLFPCRRTCGRAETDEPLSPPGYPDDSGEDQDVGGIFVDILSIIVLRPFEGLCLDGEVAVAEIVDDELLRPCPGSERYAHGLHVKAGGPRCCRGREHGSTEKGKEKDKEKAGPWGRPFPAIRAQGLPLVFQNRRQFGLPIRDAAFHILVLRDYAVYCLRYRVFLSDALSDASKAIRLHRGDLL
ncbi:MAG: hypothetical protein A4E60_00135 [Syntrophorhabdus sp. PtaB.Bin047]|nr:MAG: hypothetical protein A4E60_00135 [Syntrophorhabdus sp. PtaB.Bin047]